MLGRIPTVSEASGGIALESKLNFPAYEQQMKQVFMRAPDALMTKAQFAFTNLADVCISENIPIREKVQLLASKEFENLAKAVSEGEKSSKLKDKGEIL